MKKSYIGVTICKTCSKEFTRRLPTDKSKLKSYYCSVNCKRNDTELAKSAWTDERKKQQSIRVKGSNNPNHGNKWTDDQKSIASNLAKLRYVQDTTLAERCGSANRGKKFSQERIDAMHQNRTADSYRRQFSEGTKKIIGLKSKEKWTEDYKAKHRECMEKSGRWIPLDDIDPYTTYYKSANWIESMIDYFSESELAALETYGMFSRYNTAGWVRDHIVPRKVGWEYQIPVEIIRHPANLQFISHRDNVKKGFSDSKLTSLEKNSIITNLLEEINNYNKQWKEQEICKHLIQERRKI